MAKNTRYLYKAPPKPVKLDKKEKEELLKIVKEEIAKTTKLKKDIVRIDIKAGRIYLISHWELKGKGPFRDNLKTGDKIEEKYARITIFDKDYKNCTLDWLKHTNKWAVMEKGSLIECLKEAEENQWFHSHDDI